MNHQPNLLTTLLIGVLSLWPLWLVVGLVIVDQTRLNFLYRFGARREVIIKRALQIFLVLGLLGILAVAALILWARSHPRDAVKLLSLVVQIIMWVCEGPAHLRSQ